LFHENHFIGGATGEANSASSTYDNGFSPVVMPKRTEYLWAKALNCHQRKNVNDAASTKAVSQEERDSGRQMAA